MPRRAFVSQTVVSPTFVHLATLVATACLLLLSACGTTGSPDTAASRPTTGSVTVTTSAGDRGQTSDDQNVDTRSGEDEILSGHGRPLVTTVSNTKCSTDGSSAIAGAARRIAPPLSYNRGVPWVFGGKANYNTCRTLSYAALDTRGATASSPMQLLLFHKGKFVGTGIKCNVAYQHITRATDTAVYVTYHYLNDGDISANPTGSVNVWFEWTGSHVRMHGTLPYLVTYGKC